MTAGDDARPAALQQEWLLLQGQHESYELWALIVKLSAVVVLAFASAATASIAGLLLSLWGMEAVLKTFQSRLGERLLHIEALLCQPTEGEVRAMQLHSEWQAARPGTAALLAAYLRAGCRPTVAFPYPLLFALLLLLG